MAEAEEPDFTKLSLEDKLTHKVWKARVLGYEEAIKLFKRLDGENSPEYSKYVGLLKKFVTESNAIAQEKAVETTLVFVEHAACAAKVCADVVTGIVTKCLNARAKTKEAAISVCLMYIEIEKQEIVQEEIMKGFTNKQPKIVAASIDVMKRALSEFGSKVMNMKLFLKSLAGLFEHSDKNVRAEAKAFALEIYRWVGPTLTTLLKDKVKPVQLKELEEEIEKMPQEKVQPTRYLRSQQAPPPSAADTSTGGDEEVEEDDDDPGMGEQIDPYEMLPAVNILGQLPADFEENITHTKWQQRKEALETVLKLTANPKLESGDYGELMRMLKKVVAKDTNVMLVALAGKAVADLAKGLRKNFYPYSSVMLAVIFEKFKEKKATVVAALREAADAIYLCTTMGNIQEDLVTAMANKNPAARAETLLFMQRSFQLCTPDMLSKPFLKAICPLIVSQLGDTTPQVRDASAEALATVWKVTGDRLMTPYLEGLDKTKMTKVEEFKEKVEIKVVAPKPSKPKKEAAAPVSKPPKKPAADTPPDEPVPKPVRKKKPAAEGKKPPAEAEPEQPPAAKKSAKPKSAAASGGSKPASAKPKGKSKSAAAANTVDAPVIPSEPNIANEEVEEKAGEVLPSSLIAKLANSNWKERLAGCEEFQKLVEAMEPAKMQSLLFIKVLGLKPGWKDSNFQVMKAKFGLVSVLVTTSSVFGKRSTACVLPVIVDKLADVKVKPQSIDTLMAMAERLGLNFISTQVLKHALEQKSPKVQSESLDWLSVAIKDFGFRIEIKSHVDAVKKALGATNPAVRSSAVTLLGVMHMYMGPQLRMFFDGEKPALLAQIDAEFEKVSGESPPAPTRGVAAAAGGDDDSEEDETVEESGSKGGAAAKPQSLADLMPKVDISGQIKSSLIKELADKNWKIRGEALQKITDILKEAKFIEPSLGELPAALKGRLADANKNLIVITLGILSTMATAMGSGAVKHVKVLMTATISVLSDSKAHVRQAAIETMNTWLEQTGMTCFVEAELFTNALATESPFLRTDLYKWLSEKLPDAGKLPNELLAIIPVVYASLEDRSPDVRKSAQLLIPALMQRVGYDVMVKQTGKLKPTSKQAVVGILEKHKPTAPPPKSKATSKPAVAASTKQPPSELSEPSHSTETSSTTTTATKRGGKPSAKTRGTVKSKDTASAKPTAAAAAEDEGSPLLMSSKNQRTKDEQQLKTLKWNFASPRTEHIEQLKEQFAPCVSGTLRSQLFHSDFKFHLVALSTLTQCIEDHNAETVANIDLILRWTTLRFFDTNTSVTLKCLEYLQSLFGVLVTAEYRMSDYEAYAFIPYLVLKVGDSKDPVRKGVRVLFGQLCCVYPPGKLFTYLVDGLKSKNARQRTECLEELGILIQNNGMVVCQPTPQKAVQVIAQQISDRDTNVRNAALNTLVVVYDNIGDTVYKYAGQISPKDNSLLEERIKRSGKKPQPAPAAAPATMQPQAKMPAEGKQDGKQKQSRQQQHKQQQRKSPTEEKEVPASDDSKDEETAIPAATKLPAPSGIKPPPSTEPSSQDEPAPAPMESTRPQVVAGPFKLDSSKYGKNSGIPKLGQGKLKLEQVDYAIIDKTSDEAQTSYTTSQLLANPPKTLAQSPARIASTSAAINYIISQITNANTSETALHQMETYLANADSTPSLVSHIDQLLRAVLLQLKTTLQSVTQQTHSKEAEAKAMLHVKSLLSCILSVFSLESLANGASQDVLLEVQQQTMGYLLDERLNKLEEVAQVHRTFNLIMSRMLENANKNYLFGSLLQLLVLSLNPDGNPSAMTQMVMKCMWKLTKKLPQTIIMLNKEQLFVDLDKFFMDYISMNVTPSDEIAFRTVKTVIFHIVNIMGAKTMEHMTLIQNPKESAFWQYTRRTVAKRRASAGTDEQQLLASPVHVKSSSPSPERKPRQTRKAPDTLKYSSLLTAKLPPGVSKKLCEIFSAISSVEKSKQGLLALHEFKQQHPEVDLTTILQHNSKYLQGYIQRGLQTIEHEKMSGIPVQGHHVAVAEDEYTSRLQSLESLRLKASSVMNIDNWDRASESSESAVKPVPTSVPMPQHAEKAGRENKVPATGASSEVSQLNQETSTSSSLNLLDVRKRLDKLKTKT
ncbi:cytoskeleton-associated protein 5-like isoform X2 [Dysidea avara]|uniref:cytoskeleton-associated protein 5-like isoform X2 n=1 Tax=Dysidea avara TaxID=196820 RepID=UPI00332DBCE3